MNKDIKLTQSEKSYLMAIYNLNCTSDCSFIRPVDVAVYNHVSRPSVTAALKRLKNEGLIDNTSQNRIVLTEKGLQSAKLIMQRFLIIKSFLKNMKIKNETAEKDAWNIEHDVSNQTVEKMSLNLKCSENKKVL
ncbi:MAG: metal-dependent transcriptional regulator [Clostridia bacterium]|jgi:Mn-dependent DtxR family transcriptional regulator|nr:metal-dependent transcriptional regulator [Clostridia bacterium]MCI2014369.1 metal-dependent transcriptional regulator [Clostridia bacterium]